MMLSFKPDVATPVFIAAASISQALGQAGGIINAFAVLNWNWVEGLEQLGRQAGLSRRTARERAEDVVLQIQGALVLSGGLDDPTPFRRVFRKIPKEFLAPE